MKLVAALIVKNEEAVLLRCFDSLLPHVERMYINDNGSTDGTPALIRSLSMAEVHGAWVDFSYNRNLVLDAAREHSDYVLCGIDADEELVVDGEIGELTADAYTVDIHLGNTVYRRTAIVRSEFPWEWRGVIHEGLYAEGGCPASIDHLHHVHIKSYRDGARSKDPTTQERDLKLLHQAHDRNPGDSRAVFYLAQHLKDMHMLGEADQYYEKRARMGGYAEEVWYSIYMRARIRDWNGQDPREAYTGAFELNPIRAEPLYHAADWCRRNNLLNQALLYATAAHHIPQPQNVLFVESDVYEWRAMDIMTSVAWYTPQKGYVTSAAALLLERSIPPEHRARIERNIDYYTRM